MNKKTESLSDNRGLFYEMIPGVVAENKDPKDLGRIKVKLENNENMLTTWLKPTLPGIGYEHGIWIIPEIGDYVICMLKQGNPELGFWMGGFSDERQWTTKGNGATGVPNNTSNRENSKSEKYTFGEKRRYPEGGLPHENYIIKHPNGSNIVLYKDGSIIIENKFVTHWVTKDGIIQTTSSSPQNDGTYKIEEDGINKGYMKQVAVDGTIREFNPHASYQVDKDGNIDWKNDGNVRHVVEKDVFHEIHGKYDERIDGSFLSLVKGNVTMDHQGNVTWKIKGDLNIEVAKAFNIKAKDMDVKATTLSTLGAKSAEHNSGLKLVVQSPLTTIN